MLFHNCYGSVLALEETDTARNCCGWNKDREKKMRAGSDVSRQLMRE